MECPICYNIIKNSVIGSCTHHFCLLCLIKWCEFGGAKCPTCRTIISEIRHDREFDIINNPKESTEVSQLPYQISIKCTHENKCTGITLKNNYNWLGLGSRGPGVVIHKIKNKEIFDNSGLKVNDIIIFINNIPCIDHKQVIDIINRCIFINSTINFTLLCTNSNYIT